MLFSQIEFILFFGVILVFLGVARSYFLRKCGLLVASYYFYAYWDYRFLGVILAITVINYGIGLALGKTERHGVRLGLLAVSLVVTLGALGFFKYYNFFIVSAGAILGSLGLHVQTLDIILPVGISFYTFQTLSYTIDVYKKKLASQESLLDFSLFVAFFPQLVAGPIVRASHFLPQLKTRFGVTGEGLKVGGRLFVYGLFKKVFLADRLAMFVDPVFSNPAVFDTPTLWLGAIGYTLQIYFDFSGYSDMAIGMARILGFDLGRNFDFPYTSRSLSEFWRRWHISLSSWVRDYLYIPLGGNRSGNVRTCINLMVSMVIMGLWHGAAWTFVAWGALHGAGLVIERLAGHARWEIDRPPSGALIDGGKWMFTMLFVVVGWVLFRVNSFALASDYIIGMFFGGGTVAWLSPFALCVLVGTIAMHWAYVSGNSVRILEGWTWYSPALLLSLVWVAVLFCPEQFAPFIYFQF